MKNIRLKRVTDCPCISKKVHFLGPIFPESGHLKATAFPIIFFTIISYGLRTPNCITFTFFLRPKSNHIYFFMENFMSASSPKKTLELCWLTDVVEAGSRGPKTTILDVWQSILLRSVRKSWNFFTVGTPFFLGARLSW